MRAANLFNTGLLCRSESALTPSARAYFHCSSVVDVGDFDALQRAHVCVSLIGTFVQIVAASVTV
jgi:hypothetical protein